MSLVSTRVGPVPSHAPSPEPFHKLRLGALLGLLAALLLPAGAASAQLMVHPTRVVLEPNERAAKLEIINNSDAVATYRISLVNRRMGEHGEFIEIDRPLADERFADAMLRYSPRHVTLQPGASQVIRIMARRPAELAAGEYRSHLLFARQPDPAEGEPGRAAGAGDEDGARDGIGVSLTALVSVSIPVIVRQGATAADVTLANLALSDPGGRPPLLSFDMLRSGNRSVYGDLVVTFTPDGGSAVEIGRAGGVAVYTPNPLRRVKLSLAPPPGTALADGTLVVSYRERAEQGGAVLAEASLSLP